MPFKSVSNTSITGVIKDVDPATGFISGYFSIFGNVDSDGDMIMPGAFSRTLNNNYKRIRHLYQHDRDLPLASTIKENLMLKEDEKGLYFESKISQTSYGKDVILLYQDGVLDEHSIGYEVIRSRDSDTKTVERWGKRVPVKELHELKLWEGSTVTWGANEKAGTESVKSLSLPETLAKMEDITSALKNGKYTHDEIYLKLYELLKQLEQHKTDISTPPATAPDPPAVTTEELDTKAVMAYLVIQNQLIA